MSARRALALGLALACSALALLVGMLAREPSRGAPSGRIAAVDERAQASQVLDAPAPAPGAADDAPRASVALATPDPATMPFVREDLYGTVLDARTRAPIEGASVVVLAPDAYLERSPTPLAVLATDADGRFRWEGTGAFARFTARIQATGYRRERTELVSGRAQEVLLRPALSAAGRVLHARDRSPAAGVRVSLVDAEAWYDTVPEVVLTDEEGRFLLTEMPVDELAEIRLAEAGHFPELHRVRTGAEPTVDLELLLASASPVRLRLIDLETGVPLASFRGRIEYAGAFETDAAGLLEIRNVSTRFKSNLGGCLLTIESDETCTTRVILPMERLEDVHDIPLSRGSTIEGRVRDGAGAPVEGASLRMIQQQGLPMLPQTYCGLPAGVTIDVPWPGNVRVSEKGAFALDRLFSCVEPQGKTKPGRLQVHCEGWKPLSLEVEIPPSGATRWLDVVLEKGAAVGGLVQLDGEPLAGAHVRLLSGFPSCTTNDRGEYLLTGLSAGEVMLEVLTLDFEGGTRTGQTSLGEERVLLTDGETLAHDFHLLDSRLPIEGVVRDEGGTPLPAVQVFVRGEGFTFGSSGAIKGKGEPSTMTGKDGAFQLRVPNDPAPLEIVAWRAGTETSSLARPGATDVELVLPHTSKLRLTVVGEDGGSIPNLELVQWWPAGTPRDVLSTGTVYGLNPHEDGRFELDLSPGSWDLELRVAGFAPATLLRAHVLTYVAAEASVTMRRGTTLELSFARDTPAPPDARLMLFTAGEWGRVQQGDMVLVILTHMRDLRPVEGSLDVPRLAPGPHVVHSSIEGWTIEPERIDVPDVERHRVAVRWVQASAGR